MASGDTEPQYMAMIENGKGNGNGEPSTPVSMPPVKFQCGSHASGAKYQRTRLVRNICAYCNCCALITAFILILVLLISLGYLMFQLSLLQKTVEMNSGTADSFDQRIGKLEIDIGSVNVNLENYKLALLELSNKTGTGLTFKDEPNYPQVDKWLESTGSDEDRVNAFNNLIAFAEKPCCDRNIEFWIRVGNAYYYLANQEIDKNPKAATTINGKLKDANESISRAQTILDESPNPQAAANSSFGNLPALINRWRAIIEGKYGTYQTAPAVRVPISMRVKVFLDKALALSPNDAASWNTMGNWQLKVAKLSTAEKIVADSIAKNNFPAASLDEAIQAFQNAMDNYEKSASRKRIGVMVGYARALYQRNSGNDRTQADALIAEARMQPVLNADDRNDMKEAKKTVSTCC